MKSFLNLTSFTSFTMEIRTVRISGKRQITIPKAFGDFKEGEDALLIGRKNEVIIKPMRLVNAEALLSEKALGKSWKSKEDDKAFSFLQK